MKTSFIEKIFAYVSLGVWIVCALIVFLLDIHFCIEHYSEFLNLGFQKKLLGILMIILSHCLAILLGAITLIPILLMFDIDYLEK